MTTKNTLSVGRNKAFSMRSGRYPLAPSRWSTSGPLACGVARSPGGTFHQNRPWL